MRRVTKIVLLAVTLLAVVIAFSRSTTVSAQGNPTPTPTPATGEIPTIPLPSQPSLIDQVKERIEGIKEGAEDVQEAAGFLAGLKRTLQNIWNVFTNKEKRGSSLVDLVAQLLGGGSQGLEGLVEKFKDTDLFLPKFEENAVWEVFALVLVRLAWQLALLAIPIYFLSRVFGLRKDGLVGFTIGWFILIFLLASDRLMWQAMGLVFRLLISLIGGSDAINDLKTVIDAIFVSVQDHSALLPFVVISVLATIAWLWVALVRYLITLINLLVVRVITAIRLVRDLAFGRPTGAVVWLSQTLAMFLELALFWTIVKLELSILAWEPVRNWAWFLIAPATLILVFTPAKLAEGLFQHLTVTLSEPPGIEGKTSAKGPRPTEERAAKPKKAAFRKVAEGALATGAIGLDLYQQQRIAQRERVDRAQEAQIRDLQQRAEAMERGQVPNGGATRLKGQAIPVSGLPPSQTNPGPITNRVGQGGNRAALATGAISATLNAAGIKVTPATIKAVGTAAGSVIGTVSAPVAVVASTIAGLIAADAAVLWFLGKQISNHIKRYRRIGQYVQLSLDTALAAEQKALKRRLAAATVRRPKEGGE